MATKINLPKVFQEQSFYPIAELDTSITINAPGKILAVDGILTGTSYPRAFELYSHLHAGHNQAKSKSCDTLRSYNESPQQVVDRTPSDPLFCVMSQFMEDMMTRAQSRETHRKLFERTGLADPTDTNYFQDYFEGQGVNIEGLPSVMNPSTGFWNACRTRFSSQTEARKKQDGSPHDFFNEGRYEYQNWIARGYRDGFHRIPEHSWAYLMIANYELMYLAIRRKAMLFSWNILEGSEWGNYRGGSMQGTRFENPPGIIYKGSLNATPLEIEFRDTLISTLIGDGQFGWGPVGFYSADMARWLRSNNGGSNAPWGTQWKADGSNLIVNYDYNNPAHPKKSPGDNPNNGTGGDVSITPPSFVSPQPNGQNVNLAGRYMAALMLAESGSLKWVPFQYTTKSGTVTHSGYNGGNTPVNGSLGNATVSTLNNRNFGQHNIINQFQYKKPICLRKGNKVLYCNPTAPINQVQTVTIDDAGTHTFEVIGRGMQVFQL